MCAELWFPEEKIWDGQPCYIIGGGPSLVDFSWEALFDRNVLGCNVAFYMGVELVPINIFGDTGFFRQHAKGLREYADAGGVVVTPCRRIVKKTPVPWLKIMKKQLRGLALDGLGWNGNTGASAINLALHFGANPIYLLGFDMKLSPRGEGNYHNLYNHTPKQSVYKRFSLGMRDLKRDLSVKFPGHIVINLEDGTSALDEFPKQSLKDHFSFVEASNG